jgi:hypothetical protein
MIYYFGWKFEIWFNNDILFRRACCIVSVRKSRTCERIYMKLCIEQFYKRNRHISMLVKMVQQ